MLTSRCLRLLCRSAALLRQPAAPAGHRLAAAAGGADYPPPPPPPSPALLLCPSRHLRLAPAVPEGVSAAGAAAALTQLRSLCCPAARGVSPVAALIPALLRTRVAANTETRPNVRRASTPAAAAAVAQRRSYSEQHRERSRHSVVEDMRRTSDQVRARVGHMVSHENIYTVPNALCLARIALTPVIGWLVMCEVYTPALVCFVVAGVTDLLDGWIARTFPGQASLLGSFLDPLADKLLVATLFVSLTYTGLIPLGLTLLIVGRDLGLIAAASWVRYKSVPPPVTLSRYFNPTFATAQLEPTLVSKFNTFLQITLVASTLAAPVVGFVDHIALRVLWCVTAGTTVTSGMVYALLQSSTYRLMERGDDKRSP